MFADLATTMNREPTDKRREASTARWLTPQSLVGSRFCFALVWTVAGWPVQCWYQARLHDGSDEPLGLLALGAALAFVPWHGWSQPLSHARRCLLACVMVGYVVAFPFAPPLGRALLWIAGFSAIAAPPRTVAAWSALLVLSLPWVATVQFYLGYPLRCVTTQLAAGLLNLGGIAAVGEATTLRWAGERVLIDAPCSGIQMLWTLLLVAAVLANARRLDGRGTRRLFQVASAIVLVANSVRAAALFCIEVKLWPTPPFGHEGVGLVLFAAAGAGLVALSERFVSHAPSR